MYRVLLLMQSALIQSILASNYFQDLNIRPEDLRSYNKTCNEALNLMLKNPDEFWTIQMFDASGRTLPSGLLYGNLYEIGNFDECLDSNLKDLDFDFKGKYCLGVLPLAIADLNEKIDHHILQTLNFTKVLRSEQFDNNMFAGEKQMGLHIAFCVPSVCSSSDLNMIFSSFIFSEKLCRTKNDGEPLSTGTIMTISFLLFVLWLAVVSTVYETYLYYCDTKPFHELLVAFSFLANGKKLWKPAGNPDELTCLHGIKVLSMMWVVIGHEYIAVTSNFLQNYLYIVDWLKQRQNMIFIEATISVDTFLTITGLLIVYSFLISQDKGAKFNIFLHYAHRYLRLTPALAVIILIDATLIENLVNGPLWGTIIRDFLVEPCKRYWWHNLLYFQNFVDYSNCLLSTWYLAIDLQLFIFSPIVLYLLKKWPKVGVIVLYCLICAGCISPFLTGWLYDLRTNGMTTTVDSEYFDIYYAKPYTRFGPYVIGMLAGYYVYKLKNGSKKITTAKMLRLFFWPLVTSGLLGCIYSGFDLLEEGAPKLNRSLFLAFNRNAWSFGVCLVIVACVSGNGGLINDFLSLPLFQVLSKLSYSVFLVHYLVIWIRIGGVKSPVYFSNANLLNTFWGDYMLSLGLAICLYLLIESPIVTLQKYVYRRVLRKQGQPKLEFV